MRSLLPSTITRSLRWPSTVAAVMALGCSQPRNHVFYAYLFDPTNLCVNQPASVEIVDGPAPGAPCQPTCVLDPNTLNLYVTTMCPPYPLEDKTEAPDADPNCPAALAAYASGTVCGLVDAGSAEGGSDDCGAADGSGACDPEAGCDGSVAADDGEAGPATEAGE